MRPSNSSDLKRRPTQAEMLQYGRRCDVMKQHHDGSKYEKMHALYEKLMTAYLLSQGKDPQRCRVWTTHCVRRRIQLEIALQDAGV